MEPDWRVLASAALFAVTFAVVAAGRLGGRQLPRGPVALAGGLLTAALWRLGAASIDWQVILLLAALMALAALADASGLLAGARHAMRGLSATMALWSGIVLVAVASALVLNDAAIVALVPFLIPLYRSMGFRLAPVVILLAVAANLGSLLTPFGNPQNAVLANAAGLDVVDFLRVQGLLVAVGLALLALASHLEARKAQGPATEMPTRLVPHGRRWALAGIAVFLVLAILPQWPLGLGVAAAAGAAIGYAGLRYVPQVDAARAVRRGVDVQVLLLFVGLYLLTAGLPHWFPARLPAAWLEGPAAAGIATTVLSNAVGNVPAVLTLLRLEPEWTVLRAPFLVTASTLGGALLLSGSAASLLAAEQARRFGIEVRFFAFLRVAVPWVAPILLLGCWWAWHASPAGP